MYKRWDAKRCRMRTAELLDEQLFCDLYDTLKEITTEYDEPSPAELWEEADMRWKPLLAAKRPELAVEMLQEELTEKYGETSVFLVLMILMYMLVAMFRPTKDSPYHAYCAALAGATQKHPLLKRLWEGVRMTEDKEEQMGHRIGVVTSLLTEMKASGEAIDLDTIDQIDVDVLGFLDDADRMGFFQGFPDFQGIGLYRSEKVQVDGLPMPQLKRQGRTADKTETLEHRHRLQRLQKLQCSGFDCLVL